MRAFNLEHITSMLVSTTSVVEGRPVSRDLGVVTGEAIIGANVFRDMFAARGFHEIGMAGSRSHVMRLER